MLPVVTLPVIGKTITGLIGLIGISNLADKARAAKSNSLIDYTRSARVEPITLVDSSLLFSEALPDIQQSVLSIYAGYYLQAMAISNNVGKINVFKHLDRLNPNRVALDSAMDSAAGALSNAAAFESHTEAASWLTGLESYQYTLPTPHNYKIAAEASANAANDTLARERFEWEQRVSYDNYVLNCKKFGEDKAYRTLQQELANKKIDFDKDKLKAEVERYAEQQKLANKKFDLDEKKLASDNARYQDEKKAAEDEAKRAGGMTFGSDTLKIIQENSNLSVGKIFSVEITDGIARSAIPIAIRLIANTIPSNVLVDILNPSHTHESASERKHGWKSGRLEFIRDVLLCKDLIAAHRKKLMNIDKADESGSFNEIITRMRNNKTAGLVSGNPSIATASNIVVMSIETAQELEAKLMGKLSNFNIREKLMNETGLMIVVVYDSRFDRVSFYYAGMPLHTDVSVRDIKASNKGNGTDVTEILKAFQLGQSPSI